MAEKALVFVEIAAGVVLGFMLWSYIGPSLASATGATPSA